MAYIANSDRDREQMLKEIGVSDFEELIDYIPQEIRLKEKLKLPPALSEFEGVSLIEELSRLNKSGILFVGGGAYDHYVPAAVKHMLLRSEFYTAYTPYQAEVSQGTLQAIYEYQTLICRLTGMEVSNASMYDGGSALAEAALMAVHHSGKSKLLVAENINPFYRQIIETYILQQAISLKTLPTPAGTLDIDTLRAQLDSDTAAVILQNPNFFGLVENLLLASEAIHSRDALMVVSVDPISLGILQPPGEYGADIVVSEGQSLGNNLNFGGPYLGIFAARKELIRKMPGRIVAMTNDLEGKRAFVTTLQTREQHIRREKATSNICTNSQLCALAATVYMSLLGREGIRQIANSCLQKSHYLAEGIQSIPGFSLKYNAPFFKEFAVNTPVPAKKIIHELSSEGIYAGIDLETMKMGSGLLIAVTEKRNKDELDLFIKLLAGYKSG